jgi:hypothetical protein
MLTLRRLDQRLKFLFASRLLQKRSDTGGAHRVGVAAVGVLKPRVFAQDRQHVIDVPVRSVAVVNLKCPISEPRVRQRQPVPFARLPGRGVHLVNRAADDHVIRLPARRPKDFGRDVVFVPGTNERLRVVRRPAEDLSNDPLLLGQAQPFNRRTHRGPNLFIGDGFVQPRLEDLHDVVGVRIPDEQRVEPERKPKRGRNVIAAVRLGLAQGGFADEVYVSPRPQMWIRLRSRGSRRGDGGGCGRSARGGSRRREREEREEERRPTRHRPPSFQSFSIGRKCSNASFATPPAVVSYGYSSTVVQPV